LTTAVKFRRIAVAVMLTSLSVCLTACLSVRADELYRLPEFSEEYIKLQNQLDAILTLGAEYSPPTSGLNRQTVQYVDLDNSGVNEVIAFFAVPSNGTLQMYIFQNIDGDYVVAETIEGVGAAFDSVRYIDMDGDGVREIMIGWQMSSALKYLSVYSLKDFDAVLLAKADYSMIAIDDFSEDGNDDIVVLRLPTEEIGAVAEVFIMMPDGEIVSAEARLSNGIEVISRVLTGKLTDGATAVFVDSEGKFDNGNLITDICVLKDDSLVNISAAVQSGVSEETIRSRQQSSDMRGDGVITVPIPRLLKAQSETAYYAIDWYAFASAGRSTLALTTYHNNFDEWYLILPYDWRGKVSVRREDIFAGERTVIFSYITEGESPYEDFLKVYRLSGDMAEERARFPGRTMLLKEDIAVYAFELLAPPDSFGLTFDEALIKENFRLIYSEWLTGTN